jgi:hypothetical protein
MGGRFGRRLTEVTGIDGPTDSSLHCSPMLADLATRHTLRRLQLKFAKSVRQEAELVCGKLRAEG